MRIRNLKGIFTGDGFAARDGRKVRFEDCGFSAGPIDLVVDDNSGKIIEISKSSGISNREPGVDAHELIATAGFIDSHTHAFFAGERSHEFFMRWQGATYTEIAASGGGIHNTNRDTAEMPEAALIDALALRLKKMRAAGSTTVEVKSGYGKTPVGELRALKAMRQFRRATQIQSPDVRVTFLGLHALPKDTAEGAYVDSMVALLPEIQRESLADYIDAFPERGFFSLEESRRFIAAGLKHGLAAKVHADEITDMKAAASFAQLGALSVDHLQQISDEGVKSLAASGTVATLLPATSFFSNLPYANARRLWDAGVRVALATDFNPGTAPKYDLPFTQLLAASRYGMSPAEILCASTWNAAAAMGLEGDRGSLRVGQRADLLLWETPKASGPQEILEHILLGTAALQSVFVNGKS